MRNQKVTEMPVREPAYETKLVTRIEPDPESVGYYVTLACGHVSWWAISPPMERVHCSGCLDELITRMKASGAIR